MRTNQTLRPAGILALLVVLDHGAAFASLTCTGNYKAELVMTDLPSTAIQAAKIGCNMYVTGFDSGSVFKFDLCAFNAQTEPRTPISAASTLCAQTGGGDDRHAIQVVTNNPDTMLPELWVTSKVTPSSVVELSTSTCLPTGRSIAVGGIDGLSFSPLRGYTLTVAQNGAVDVDLASLTVASAPLVSTGEFVDHISWEPDQPGRFLFMAGHSTGNALVFDKVTSSLCVMANAGPGIDGVAFAPKSDSPTKNMQAWFNPGFPF